MLLLIGRLSCLYNSYFDPGVRRVAFLPYVLRDLLTRVIPVSLTQEDGDYWVMGDLNSPRSDN